MSTNTENSAERRPSIGSERAENSVVSVDFAGNFDSAGKAAAERTTSPEEPRAAEKKSGRRHLKWFNAAAVAAILIVGALHFAFQISFRLPFETEKSENRPPVAAPPVAEKEIDRAVGAAAELSPPAAAVKTTRPTAAPVSRKEAAAAPRRPTPAPERPAASKEPVRKKTGVETKAERLRRLERLLTGI